ncbi:NAD(P)-dependent oxidoreductase [Dictyobacter kobayashii]|uniref:Lactate dehydrogenase n=1 Tax=Dictyobacter kobayashii TaxID=2014872 RepID=A0A402AUA7_9CHLR|nr:NAD(P)-dependent oxidoreductase [Dictyobacter kobayashii]GCE22655.1 lactate dehydrogenase [Dictyobacter kobayashii]
MSLTSHDDTRMHILVPTINEEDGKYLAMKLDKDFSLTILEGTLDEVDKDTLARTNILLPFIQPHIKRAQLETMPRLKLIATRSTGYDHIDRAAAAERGILIANVPGYGETAVAEHTFALLLTLSRKMQTTYDRIKEGNYSVEGLQGFDLYGKTLGVIGTGAIGLHVIRIARGFGMEVIANDIVQNKFAAEVLGFRYTSRAEVLSNADIVTLHAPALPSTYHLINRDSLSGMKKGAILINTARGSLVDTEALAWALEAGILRGAGLDALEGEELLQHFETSASNSDQDKLYQATLALQKRQNVFITPHVAFNTTEALRRILDTTVENVYAFAQGRPTNLVKLPELVTV